MNIEMLTALAAKNIEQAPANLGDFARSQLDRFSRQGFNELIQDSYKFTNLERFFADLKVSNEVSQNSNEELDKFEGFLFKNGILQTPKNLPSGVSFRVFSPQSIEEKKLLTEKSPLSSLHHALLGHGVIIEVSKGTILEEPIRILHWLSESKVVSPTVVVNAHPQSKMTILEETKYVGEASSANIAETYIQAHSTASVEHISLDQGNHLGINHSSLTADIEKDAEVRAVFLNVSGKLTRKNLVLNLNAPGANAENYALFLTNGHEHSDIHTEINHKSEDTTSKQIAKGILDENSKGIFTGRIHIFPKAQRVSSSQLNKNLLLSIKAQVHSQPQLEIFADDVKCSHGSTTGQLSSDEVFYFETRGIPAEKARTLIALGFGLEIVQKIKNSKAQNYVLSIVREKLAEKFSIGGSL